MEALQVFPLRHIHLLINLTLSDSVKMIITVNFIVCLLCARHCSECFTSTTSFNPHDNSKNFVLF